MLRLTQAAVAAVLAYQQAILRAAQVPVES
jgi:hypothetical protein